MIPVSLFGQPFASRLPPSALLELEMYRILRYPLGTPPCGAQLVVVLPALMPALVPLETLLSTKKKGTGVALTGSKVAT